MTKRVLILGGGITGLTAAWRAARAGLDATLFEASDHTGGMGGSRNRDGFVIDHGIHGLYSAREETKPIIAEMVAEFGEDFLTISKKTSIHFRERYLKYPLGIKELFRALPLTTSFLCGIDFFKTRVRGRLKDIGFAESFEEWVTDRFGHKLYEIYFGPYVEKVWGLPGTEMSSAWLARRISTISIVSVIRSALKALFTRRDPDEMHSLQPQTFLYPREGSGQFVGRVHAAAQTAGACIVHATRVTHIAKHGDGWEVEIEDRQGKRVEHGDAIVSTLPLPLLVQLLGDALPDDVREAAARLRYRSMCIVNLYIDRPNVYQDQWVYYSAPHLPFNRINEFTNLAPGFSPAGKTALNCEITCFRGDETWNRSDEDLRSWCAEHLERLGLLDPAHVFDSDVMRLPNAYPVFDVGCETRLKRVLESVEGSGNLFTAGRQGRFEYINMDECIWHATRTVADIVAGRREPSAHAAPLGS